MEYYQPFRVNDGRHKFGVRVWNPQTRRDKTVLFGHIDYEDFTQHHDPKRKNNYLTRSAGIRDGRGRLTKDDPLSPNYWARRYLWDSREKWYIHLPPGYKLKSTSSDVKVI